MSTPEMDIAVRCSLLLLQGEQVQLLALKRIDYGVVTVFTSVWGKL